MEKLQDICRWRRKIPADLAYGTEDAYNQIPEKLKPEHGYHWDCYQGFTKHTDRLKSSTADSKTIQKPRTSGRSSTASEEVIFKPNCIFFNKE